MDWRKGSPKVTEPKQMTSLPFLVAALPNLPSTKHVFHSSLSADPSPWHGWPTGCWEACPHFSSSVTLPLALISSITGLPSVFQNSGFLLHELTSIVYTKYFALLFANMNSPLSSCSDDLCRALQHSSWLPHLLARVFGDNLIELHSLLGSNSCVLWLHIRWWCYLG